MPPSWFRGNCGSSGETGGGGASATVLLTCIHRCPVVCMDRGGTELSSQPHAARYCLCGGGVGWIFGSAVVEQAVDDVRLRAVPLAVEHPRSFRCRLTPLTTRKQLAHQQRSSVVTCAALPYLSLHLSGSPHSRPALLRKRGGGRYAGRAEKSQDSQTGSSHSPSSHLVSLWPSGCLCVSHLQHLDSTRSITKSLLIRPSTSFLDPLLRSAGTAISSSPTNHASRPGLRGGCLGSGTMRLCWVHVRSR